jgi:gamma-glutamyltranspeptidase/glutathione hydrolase
MAGPMGKLNGLVSRRLFLEGAGSLLAAGSACAQTRRGPSDDPIISGYARNLPVLAEHGMVVSQEAVASRIGVDILRAGGNAVDAAVATGFALAVTLPRAGNIGGGGFMLVHIAARNETVAIDYREMAGALTTRDAFLDENGRFVPAKSQTGGLGVGVPGTVAGFALAHEKYGSGRFTFGDLVAPAIALARDGFTVDEDLADSLPSAVKRFSPWPSSRSIFMHADGTPLRRGEYLVQRDLAATLEGIAKNGDRSFYEGDTARLISEAVQAAGGRMTREDLAS